MGKRQWMREKQKLETVVSKKEIHSCEKSRMPKYVCLLVYAENKSNNWAGLEPLLMIFFTSQNKDETVSSIISSIQRKMSQNGRNKVLGLNLSGLSIKPFNSPAEVSTSPCVCSVHSLLKKQVKFPLAWLSEKNGQQGRRKPSVEEVDYHH